MTADLLRYQRSRERVLGDLRVSRDPELAAAMLAEHLGGHEAVWRWARAVVAMLPTAADEEWDDGEEVRE